MAAAPQRRYWGFARSLRAARSASSAVLIRIAPMHVIWRSEWRAHTHGGEPGGGSQHPHRALNKAKQTKSALTMAIVQRVRTHDQGILMVQRLLSCVCGLPSRTRAHRPSTQEPGHPVTTPRRPPASSRARSVFFCSGSLRQLVRAARKLIEYYRLFTFQRVGALRRRRRPPAAPLALAACRRVRRAVAERPPSFNHLPSRPNHSHHALFLVFCGQPHNTRTHRRAHVCSTPNKSRSNYLCV